MCYTICGMANGFLQQEEKEFSTFYKRSVWWVEHRALLKRIGLIVWGVVDAALLLFAVWVLVDSFLISYTREDVAMAQMAVGQNELHAFTTAHAAKDLSIGTVQTFPLSDNRYDLYVPISNPNPNFYAQFSYAFVTADGETDEQTGFILPNETNKPLMSLAYSSTSKPVDPKLDLRNFHWYRVDPHVFPDYASWAAERFAFNVTNVNFSTDIQLDKEQIGRVSFTVSNPRPYSYWEPGFYILLERGTSVVGVTRTTLDKFQTGDSRDVTVNWFGALPAVSKVEVIPEVNLFDINSYMPLTGETQTDIRNRVFGR